MVAINLNNPLYNIDNNHLLYKTHHSKQSHIYNNLLNNNPLYYMDNNHLLYKTHHSKQSADIEKYNPNIGKLPEVNKFICTLCQTQTIYDIFEKLQHHRKRFHEAFFSQTERGTKIKKYKDENEDKKLKTENPMIGKGVKDGSGDEEFGDDDREYNRGDEESDGHNDSEKEDDDENSDS